jgi:hypothetical protein
MASISVPPKDSQAGIAAEAASQMTISTSSSESTTLTASTPSRMTIVAMRGLAGTGGGDSHWKKNDFGIHTLENVGINKENPAVKLDIGKQASENGSWVNTLLDNDTNSSYSERYTCSAVNSDGQIFVASFREERKFSIHTFSAEGEHLDSETFALDEFEIDSQTVYYAVPKKLIVDPEGSDPDLLGFSVIQLLFYSFDGPDSGLPLSSAIVFTPVLDFLLVPPPGYSLLDIAFAEDLSIVGTALKFTSGVPELILYSYSGLYFNKGNPPDWVKSYPLEGLIPQGAELGGSVSFPSSIRINQTGDIVTLLNLGLPTYNEQTEEFGFTFLNVLLKFDSTGAEQWGLNFSSYISISGEPSDTISFENFSNFSIGSDGFITLAGGSIEGSFGDFLLSNVLSRISPSGVVAWSKKYQVEIPEDESDLGLLFPFIAEGSDGNLLLVSSQPSLESQTGEPGKPFLLISELSSSGEPLSSIKLTSNPGYSLFSSWGSLDGILNFSTFSDQPEEGYVFLTNGSPHSQLLKIFGPPKELQSFGELYKVVESGPLGNESTTLAPESISLSSQIPVDFEISLLENPPENSQDDSPQFLFRLDSFDDPILSRVDGCSEFDSVSTERLFVNSVPVKALLEDNVIAFGLGAGGLADQDLGVNNIYIGNYSGPQKGNSGSDSIYIGHFSGNEQEESDIEFQGNVVIGNNCYYPSGSNGGLLIGSYGGVWIYGDKNYNIAIGTESTEEKLNVGGNIAINETTVYGSQTVFPEDSPTVILHDNLNAGKIRSVEYTIQVEASDGKFQVSKLMCVHDESDVFVNQYMDVLSQEELATFEVSLLDGFVVLEATPLIQGINQYSIRFEAIRSYVGDVD